MALKNIPIKENYDCSKIIENGQMVVINSPLVIYSPSTSTDCSLVLNSCKDNNVFNQNLPDLILDADFFHCDHSEETSKNLYDLTKIIDLSNKTDSSKGVAVLEIFSNPEHDRPELIDISELSEIRETSKDTQENVLELSDDDEVIFVKEYNKPTDSGRSTGRCIQNADNIRRNPVRNVRNKSKNLSNELLFEEDFAFLDASEDEIEEKENKTDKKTQIIKLPKEWPINVHERPEYNEATKTIESFDYTIREIQKKSTTVKKTKTETGAVRKNPKKKPLVRRRRRKATPAPIRETVSLEKLKPLINSTTDMLKEYFLNIKKHKDIISSNSEICSFENKLEILKNQAFLFAIVNNLDEREVVDKFKHLNLDNDAKS